MTNLKGGRVGGERQAGQCSGGGTARGCVRRSAGAVDIGIMRNDEVGGRVAAR